MVMIQPETGVKHTKAPLPGNERRVVSTLRGIKSGRPCFPCCKDIRRSMMVTLKYLIEIKTTKTFISGSGIKGGSTRLSQWEKYHQLLSKRHPY